MRVFGTIQFLWPSKHSNRVGVVVGFEGSWWLMVVYGLFMVVYRLFMVVYGSLWVIYGGLWWLMVDYG